MDIRKVKKLIELLEQSGIAEIEIREGDDGVRISRYSTGNVAAPVALQAPAATPTPAAPPAPAESIHGSTATSPPPPSGHEVTAPMVGTFYSAPTPGARPFVEIGSQVEVGDTLCIIEAMKMMNQIEAEVAGRIVSITAENGEPVEYDQALFIID